MEEQVSTQSLLSTAKYNMVIGLVLCWGFSVNWLMVTFMNPMAVLEVVNGWVVLILYSVSSSLADYRDWETDRKSTRLNSSHITRSRMPSSA